MPTLPLLRYWNGKDHFYTWNFRELGGGAKGYSLEGTAGRVLLLAFPGATPLYRYYNGHHFYTTNPNEIGVTSVGARGKDGYVCEGNEGFCFNWQFPGTIPLHRYYNGDHFYTTDPNEIGTTTIGACGKHGHCYEGVACYVLP